MPQYFQNTLLSIVLRQQSSRKLHIGDNLKRCCGCGALEFQAIGCNPGRLLSVMSISAKWASVLMQNPNYTIVSMVFHLWHSVGRHRRRITHRELRQNDHKILISKEFKFYLNHLNSCLCMGWFIFCFIIPWAAKKKKCSTQIKIVAEFLNSLIK